MHIPKTAGKSFDRDVTNNSAWAQFRKLAYAARRVDAMSLREACVHETKCVTRGADEALLEAVRASPADWPRAPSVQPEERRDCE